MAEGVLGLREVGLNAGLERHVEAPRLDAEASAHSLSRPRKALPGVEGSFAARKAAPGVAGVQGVKSSMNVPRLPYLEEEAGRCCDRDLGAVAGCARFTACACAFTAVELVAFLVTLRPFRRYLEVCAVAGRSGVESRQHALVVLYLRRYNTCGARDSNREDMVHRELGKPLEEKILLSESYSCQVADALLPRSSQE